VDVKLYILLSLLLSIVVVQIFSCAVFDGTFVSCADVLQIAAVALVRIASDKHHSSAGTEMAFYVLMCR